MSYGRISFKGKREQLWHSLSNPLEQLAADPQSWDYLGACEANLTYAETLKEAAHEFSRRDPAVDSDCVDLYFNSLASAQRWWINRGHSLEQISDIVAEIYDEKDQNWNALWNLNFAGTDCPPHWKILPTATDGQAFTTAGAVAGEFKKVIWLDPSMGFGTGTHPTTRLCLETIGAWTATGWRVLDFGCGSGILGVAAILQGADRVDAVEIDDDALESARDTARKNAVTEKMNFSTTLPGDSRKSYDLVVANILRPTLLEFGEQLISQLSAGGRLLISGLLDDDEVFMTSAYLEIFKKYHRAATVRVFKQSPWVALLFQSPA